MGSNRVEITGPSGDRYAEILTPKALDLLVALHDALRERRHEALNARRARQALISSGASSPELRLHSAPPRPCPTRDAAGCRTTPSTGPSRAPCGARKAWL